MNYNVFTLAIRKNIKIYTFLKSLQGLGLKVRCEKLKLLQLLRILKYINLNLKIWHFSDDYLSVV